MELRDAVRVTWLRAVEETDPRGEILSESDRVEASKAAGVECDRQAFLLGRVEWLGAKLDGDGAAPASLGVPGALKLGVVLAAFVGGFAVDRFGGGREINVLAFPLMGLLAWNLALYVAMLVGRFKAGGGGGAPWVSEIARRCASRGGDAPRGRFFDLWWPMAGRVEVGGVRAALHLAAAAAAVGVVAGMYWRGVATEYRAVWESTFLSASAAGSFLSVVLAPASLVTGSEIPELSGEVFSKEETATWIHLFAVTAGLVIVLPRVLLAGVWLRRTGRLRRSFEFEDEGWERYEGELRHALKGGTTVVDVVPFANALGDASKTAVRGYAVKRWGGGAVIEFGDVVRYGEEDEFLAKLERGKGAVRLVVFQLTATPEDEVQGHFVRCVRDKTDGDVVMLVDGRGFGERFGTMPEYGRRASERRAAWESVIRGDGFETGILGGGA